MPACTVHQHVRAVADVTDTAPVLDDERASGARSSPGIGPRRGGVAVIILAAVLVVAFVAAAVRCGLHRTRPGVRPPVVVGYVPRHAHTPGRQR